VVAAVVSTTLVVAGAETMAWRTYRPAALLHPTFSGSLSLAPKLIGPANTAIARIEDFRTELGTIVSGAAKVYGSIETSGLGAGDAIRVLHISDIHLSPLGLTFAQELARAFNVDFVVDTGDLTSFGTPAESLILRFMSGFDVPYVYVRGNHDSTELSKSMARIPNVTVLDGATKTIDGITVYGLGDPAFTPNKLLAIDDATLAGLVRSVGPRIAADVESLASPPTIVAVHDERMADDVAGLVPLVISGHFHVFAARERGGTVYLQVGSTGGAGANVFTQEGGIPLSAEVLSFERAAPHRLVAFDRVQQSPETGSLTVERHIVSEEFPPEPLAPPPPTTLPPTGATESPAPETTAPSEPAS
jgi:predicted phosphodiesterase